MYRIWVGDHKLSEGADYIKTKFKGKIRLNARKIYISGKAKYQVIMVWQLNNIHIRIFVCYICTTANIILRVVLDTDLARYPAKYPAENLPGYPAKNIFFSMLKSFTFHFSLFLFSNSSFLSFDFLSFLEIKK